MPSGTDQDAPQRVLLVGQRPVDSGGGRGIRWRYLREALPALGWTMATVTVRSPPASTEPRTVLHAGSLYADRTAVALLLPAARPELAARVRITLGQLGHRAGCGPPDDEEAIAAALGRLLDDPPPPVDPARLEPWSRAEVAQRVATLLGQLAGEPS